MSKDPYLTSYFYRAYAKQHSEPALKLFQQIGNEANEDLAQEIARAWRIFQ